LKLDCHGAGCSLIERHSRMWKAFISVS
jgi:hypothetical protein